VTLKTGVNDAENSALHQRNTSNFKLWKENKTLTYIVIIFHNIIVNQINLACETSFKKH